MNGRQKRFSVLAPRKICAPARRHPAGADHLHPVADKADHVVDGVARFDMAARRIDDDADIAFAFGIGEKLGGDPLGHLHVDFAEDQHGARLEQRLGDLGEDCGSGDLDFSSSFSSSSSSARRKAVLRKLGISAHISEDWGGATRL